MERGIRVFLLAANRLVRDALTRVLTRKGDIHVVGSAACSSDVVRLLLHTRHDLLLADWGSCSPEIIEALGVVRQKQPNYKSILLGMRDDRGSFLQAVQAGAKGILLEDASASDVTAAVHAVVDGRAVCPVPLCNYLFDYIAHFSRYLPNARLRLRLGLTRREQQLIPLIACGYTNKEIATQLRLSEQTVKNHIHRMLQKTGTNGRLEVVEACENESPVPAGAPP